MLIYIYISNWEKTKQYGGTFCRFISGRLTVAQDRFWSHNDCDTVRKSDRRGQFTEHSTAITVVTLGCAKKKSKFYY